jgi:predicted  nucleic acid-binding Zn-ribbon protein
MASYEDMGRLIDHETNQCDAGNSNTMRLEMQRLNNEVVELQNEILGLKEHIAVIEEEKCSQVEKHDEIQKKIKQKSGKPLPIWSQIK